MVNIRAAVPGDARTLAQVHTESWRSTFERIVPAAILAAQTDLARTTSQYRSILAAGRGHGYLLELDGAPHCIAWWDAAREEGMPGFAELICIHSRVDNRRRGYGGMLLRRVLADAEAAGRRGILLWVFTDNLPAVRFYRSHGFSPTGRTQLAFGAAEEMYQKEFQVFG